MSTTSTRQGILSLTLKDRAALYSAYMMYMQNGAIFVPTPKRYFLGNKAIVLRVSVCNCPMVQEGKWCAIALRRCLPACSTQISQRTQCDCCCA